MANTNATSVTIPTPPRLTGDWQIDYQSLNDWLSDFVVALTQQSGTTVDPSSLPDPGSTSVANAQLIGNTAMSFCAAINAALGSASVAGFPIAPPTS
jgi:hypothetical protein